MTSLMGRFRPTGLLLAGVLALAAPATAQDLQAGKPIG